MKRVVVSNPAGGINPFNLTRQGTTMRGLAKALDLVVLAGSKESLASHGLRVAVARSNAIITNIRRSGEAEGAKETLQPFLVAIDLAQIVIRRRRGLLVTRELYRHALQLVEDMAKACRQGIYEAMTGDDDSPSWPHVEITPELDKIAVLVSRGILAGLP